MRKFLATTSICVITGPVFAAGLSAPVEDPMVEDVAPMEEVHSDEFSWTGGYAGLQVGYADATAFDGPDVHPGNGALGGLHAGYRHDFGGFVLGVEVSHDWADITLGGPGPALDVDNVTRAMLTAGYASGANLFYAAFGAAEADISSIGPNGTADGEVYGIGYARMINPNFVMGVELLHYDLDADDVVPGATAEADSIQLKASMKF